MTKCNVKSCNKKADVKDKGTYYCAKCWIKIRYQWFKHELTKENKTRRIYG